MLSLLTGVRLMGKVTYGLQLCAVTSLLGVRLIEKVTYQLQLCVVTSSDDRRQMVETGFFDNRQTVVPSVIK